MKDIFKAIRSRDLTCWDLNVRQYVHFRPKNRKRLTQKFNKKARRKLKKALQKEINVL